MAILSDVHANLEALMAVQRALQAQRLDQVWFLGDAVGYGPEPNECLDLLRTLCQVFLMGNHDAAAVGMTDVNNFNIYARAAVEYTAGILTPDNRQFLRLLPYLERRRGITLVHASPDCPPEWLYLLTPQDGARAFEQFAGTVCCVGHSHRPLFMSRISEGMVSVEHFTGRVQLEMGRRYIFNVGSVGQPRDGDPRAAFALYDDESGELALQRVPYEMAAVQAKMRQAGLPDYLITRLAKGK